MIKQNKTGKLGYYQYYYTGYDYITNFRQFILFPPKHNCFVISYDDSSCYSAPEVSVLYMNRQNATKRSKQNTLFEGIK